MKKWVYLFNEVKEAEKVAGGSWDAVKGLVGGKGSGLLDMTRAGVPVPPFFTVTTEACNAYQNLGKFPAGLWDQELKALKQVEKKAGKKFGDPKNPLLVSCRSGAKFSMPGMMDTVLNLGLTDVTAAGMVKLTGNARFVYDSYRRLVEMFSSVVLGIPDESFEGPLHEYKHDKGYKLDTEMTADDWKEMVEAFKAVIRLEKGFDFPQDPYKQLELSTEAVFKSWNGKRAIDYRNATGISHSLGTAVNIQTMVFGNMGNNSATGVAFTRDPSTGEKRVVGEYLLNAQGDDVIAGILNTYSMETMKTKMPKIYEQFLDITSKLEKHFKDMQDVEFTIERGKLWMLQTRSGKRTAQAAIKIAVDLANQGLITREDAIRCVTPGHVDAALQPQLKIRNEPINYADNRQLTTGIGASPGIAIGKVYFDADSAEHANGEYNENVILIQSFCRAEDIHGMLASKGVITSEGGSTSQAAIVARQFNIPCVIGASELIIDSNNRKIIVNDSIIEEGQVISLDGSNGKVYMGALNQDSLSDSFNPLDRIGIEPGRIEENESLQLLLSWTDAVCKKATTVVSAANTKKLGFEVWANADYPKDVRRARSYGAVGIGLCRTEHMFFEPERLPIVQKMILADSSAERIAALTELLPHQRKDFDGLFEATDGYPIVIRLIDPPLHEFMPDEEALFEEVITMRVKGETYGLQAKADLLESIKGMHESNPMMGLRGARLSIVMPEIVEMQVRAIFEAAADCTLRGIITRPQVMIPMTGEIKELEWIQPRLERIADSILEDKRVKVEYKFGTMIEVPRAAITASKIANLAQFFSFGTNDLTQMIFGYSRDDAERNFLSTYQEQGILGKNPFQSLDREGVGKFMQWAVDDGRKTRPDLQVGICGEHGGDPESIEFCYVLGLNYVSSSPYRVPIARLSAAHAVLKHQKRITLKRH